MFNPTLGMTSSLFPGLDDRLRVCAELLVAGVAFQVDGKTWKVFSHEGEEIGNMSTYWVSSTVCAMKKIGWKPYGGVTDIHAGDKPSVTFGMDVHMTNFISESDWDAMMKRRHKKIVTIH